MSFKIFHDENGPVGVVRNSHNVSIDLDGEPTEIDYSLFLELKDKPKDKLKDYTTEKVATIMKKSKDKLNDDPTGDGQVTSEGKGN